LLDEVVPLPVYLCCTHQRHKKGQTTNKIIDMEK
jgi:hypothetical protein